MSIVLYRALKYYCVWLLLFLLVVLPLLALLFFAFFLRHDRLLS